MPNQGGGAPTLLAVPDLRITYCMSLGFWKEGKWTRLDSPIMAATDKPHFISRNGPYPFDVPETSFDRLACVNIPRFYGVVETARDKDRTTSGRKVIGFCFWGRRGIENTAVLGSGRLLLALGQRPLHVRQLERLHLADVAGEDPDACLQGKIPESYGAII